MSKNIIEIDNVWKVYQMEEVKVEALRGLNIKIKKGEFVIIQGPSGSGKSTTFNMIGCLDIPTKGKILLDGKDISKLSESNLANIRGKKIGFIFQTFNLMPSLSALENVYMPSIFHSNTNSETIKKAKELLEKVGLSHRINHKPSELSGGERQRVAIARSLINDPEVILADEPTGNLDSKTGENIIKILNDLNKKDKKTIVMVTHEKLISARYDRVIRIKDGKVENE